MKKTVSLITALVLLISALLVFSSCQEPTVSESFFAMDTYMTITVPKSKRNAATKAMQRVFELDSLFSPSKEGSDIYKLNRANGEAVTVSPETAMLIKKAEDMRAVLPAFDISLYGVILLWGFESTPKVPEQSAISAEMQKKNSGRIIIDGLTVTLTGGIKINLAAIAKGYASDEVKRILTAEGVTSAIINLGGNVCVMGKKANGQSYRVGIRLPYSQSESVAILEDTEGFYVTSGCYERYFEENGKEYCHILNPETGEPPETDLLSVTIVGEFGTDADVLSTAFFVMGSAASLEFLNENKLCEAVFITKNREIIVTSGLKGKITVLNTDYFLKG